MGALEDLESATEGWKTTVRLFIIAGIPGCTENTRISKSFPELLPAAKYLRFQGHQFYLSRSTLNLETMSVDLCFCEDWPSRHAARELREKLVAQGWTAEDLDAALRAQAETHEGP